MRVCVCVCVCGCVCVYVLGLYGAYDCYGLVPKSQDLYISVSEWVHAAYMTHNTTWSSKSKAKMSCNKLGKRFRIKFRSDCFYRHDTVES